MRAETIKDRLLELHADFSSLRITANDIHGKIVELANRAKNFTKRCWKRLKKQRQSNLRQMKHTRNLVVYEAKRTKHTKTISKLLLVPKQPGSRFDRKRKMKRRGELRPL